MLWFYFENDLSDLDREMKRPALARYLADGFAQGLASRQSLVDSVVAARLAVEESLFVREEKPGAGGFDATYFATLGPLRSAIAQLLGAGSRRAEQVRVHDPARYREILAKGKSTVERWGGRMVLVYLPSSRRYDPDAPGKINRRQLAMRDTVLSFARELHLEVVDVDSAFRANGDPMDWFAYTGGHYNEAGHAIAARAVLSRLDKSVSAPRVE